MACNTCGGNKRTAEPVAPRIDAQMVPVQFVGSDHKIARLPASVIIKTGIIEIALSANTRSIPLAAFDWMQSDPRYKNAFRRVDGVERVVTLFNAVRRDAIAADSGAGTHKMFAPAALTEPVVSPEPAIAPEPVATPTPAPKKSRKKGI